MNAENFLAIDRDLARQVLVFTLSLIAKCFNFAEFEFWGGNQDKDLGKFWGKKLLCWIYGVRIFKMSFYFFARSL